MRSTCFRIAPMAALMLAGLVWQASAADSSSTAFELIKEGNRYVGEQSKDKIVQIRSEKSIQSTTPNVWFIVYYDPTATLKATEVKFGAGRMLSVKRPMRILEVVGRDTPLDRDKIKVDSDAAIEKAMEEPMLKDIKITNTQLKLERVGQGVLGIDSTGEAAWKVRLWAPRIRNSSKTENIGEIWVSANDGKIVKTDLHLDRLD